MCYLDSHHMLLHPIIPLNVYFMPIPILIRSSKIATNGVNLQVLPTLNSIFV
jgi:hypothetical protein